MTRNISERLDEMLDFWHPEFRLREFKLTRTEERISQRVVVSRLPALPGGKIDFSPSSLETILIAPDTFQES